MATRILREAAAISAVSSSSALGKDQITDYATQLSKAGLKGDPGEKGAAGIPPAPTEIGHGEGSAIKPGDIWVIGTANEKLHYGGIPA